MARIYKIMAIILKILAKILFNAYVNEVIIFLF